MTMTAQNNAPPAGAPPAVDNGQGSNVPAVALGTPGNVNIGAPASAPAAPTSGGIVNAAADTVGPETSMAQHVLDALGGTGDKPGDWAKAVIAGGLTSTATKGSPLSDMPDTSKMPKGASPVAFAIGETMKNRDARLRQSRMDAQAQKQQQFENQLKLKQDARSQQQLDNSTKSTDAQVAMYTIQTAAAKRQEWEMEQRYPDLRKEDQDRVRQLDDQVRTSESESMSVLAAAGVDVTKLQHITDSNDLTKDQVTQAAQGQLLALPNGKKGGTGDGGAYLAPASIWDQKITEPVTVTKGWTVDNKTGKETPIQITAQPGTTVGTLLAIAKGAQADRQTKHQAITDQLDIEQKESGITEARARAKLLNLQANQYMQDDKPNIFGDTGATNPVSGQPMTPKEKDAAWKTFNEKTLQPLQTTVNKSFNMAETAYNEYQQAKAQGKDLPSGAQSMMMLSQHLSTTFGNVKGSRITKDMIQEHLGARGLTDDAKVAVQRITNGDALSPKQWDAFMDLISQSREYGYNGAIDNARSNGIGKSVPAFLPTAPAANQKIDPSTARIYMYAAHGDPAKALAAAKQAGWGVGAQQ